jgi:hypothetical protein
MATMTTMTHPNAMDWSQWEMPVHVCKVCRLRTSRPRIVFDSKGNSEVYCGLHLPRAHRSGGNDSAKNPFQNFTLDHVRDENGQKITVNSLAELRAAEKKHGFALAVATDDGGTAANPPQHDPGAGDITRNYKKKFNLDPAAYADPRNKSDGGVINSAGDSLAAMPNPSGSLSERVTRAKRK